MTDTNSLDPASVGLTLEGDPTLEDCDNSIRALIELLRACGDALGAHDIKFLVTRATANCGVCEALPITWVAIERGGKIVRVARCAEHRPETDYPDLAPVLHS